MDLKRLTLTLLGLLAATAMTGCGGYVENVSIRRAVPQEQWALYQQLIPKIAGMKMPAQPEISAAGAVLNDESYLEAKVSIKVNYNGKDYSWDLTMPLNNQWGLENGLPQGYPKYLAELCRTDNGLTYTYRVDTCAAPAMEFIHTADATVSVPWTFEQESNTVTGLSIGTDGCLKASTFRLVRDNSKPVTNRTGRVQFKNRYGFNKGAVWAPLLPDGVYAGRVWKATYSDLGFAVTDVTCGVNTASLRVNALDPLPIAEPMRLASL